MGPPFSSQRGPGAGPCAADGTPEAGGFIAWVGTIPCFAPQRFRVGNCGFPERIRDEEENPCGAEGNPCEEGLMAMREGQAYFGDIDDVNVTRGLERSGWTEPRKRQP